MTKEHPILFSAPMVRAILDGRKTMTRRLVKPQPPARNDIINAAYCGHPNLWLPNGNIYADTPRKWTCPYGKPGDQLWVRETWFCDDYRVQDGPYWKPDDLDVVAAREDGTLVYRAEGAAPYEAEQPIWRPSIHMPRWASRITLEITGVRVERLQDTSEADAIAEGVQQCEGGAMDYLSNDYAQGYSPVASFRSLWESINGAGSWDANPWVWVVEFKRITP